MPIWDFSFYLFGFPSKGFSVFSSPRTNGVSQSPTTEDEEQHDTSADFQSRLELSFHLNNVPQ